MATVVRQLGRSGPLDGRAWVRFGLAGATVAVLALSALAGARTDPDPGVGSSGPAVVHAGEYRWTGERPSWRSRSEILRDAGVSR